MNSIDELIRAFDLIDEIVVEPVEYRIHHDTAGNITMCTMQDHPDDTQYIVVSKDEYDNYFRYYVVDSKLKKIDIPTSNSIQLTKSDSGYPVVKNHAGILIESNESYAKTEYYDRIN